MNLRADKSRGKLYMINHKYCKQQSQICFSLKAQCKRGRWENIPESKGWTLETFRGMPSISRKHFEKTSKA